MNTGFPYSRTIVTIQSTRTTKKTGHTSTETRHYLSSQNSAERSPEGWINLCRSHWAVENRNHYRRDVTYGEDGTRALRANPQALANMALLRNIGLRLLAKTHCPEITGCQLPAQKEYLATDTEALRHLLQQVP